MEHEQHSSINDILHHYKEGIGSLQIKFLKSLRHIMRSRKLVFKRVL